MTENLTILSPSGPTQPPSLATSTTTPEDAEDSSGEINCICEISDDDGFTICCDKCDTWQHLVCVQLTTENLPAKYYCPKCSPRPLDVWKAKEIQRQRRAEEQAKRSHKKKRPAGTSHKKKEPTNGSNGAVLGKLSSATEKSAAQAFGKLPSPKETPQSSSRKRGHRASHSTAGLHTPLQPATVAQAVSHNNNSTTSPDSPNITVPIRNGETESDTEYEKTIKKYKHEHTDVNTSPDQYAGRDAQSFLEKLATQSLDYPVLQGEPRIYYSSEQFRSVDLPRTSVRQLDSPKSHLGSGHSRSSLVLETSVSPGQLVTIYRGRIHMMPRPNESKNQLDMLHPNLYILFHPSLPIYIDARKDGSEARFVRRSCRPNLEIRMVVVDTSQVYFGLFSKDAIKAGTHLSLGWDWGETSDTCDLTQEGFDWNMIGDCQCSGGSDCPLIRIKNGITAPKPPPTNGARRKQPIKRNPSSEPPIPTLSKEPSPERLSGLLGDEDDDDSRSVSAPSSRSKPRSRDLTPSTIPDTAVETGEMTGREARKFKEVLSRIEKQQQEEQLPQSVKRKKRNSTVSLSTGTLSLPSPGIELKDGTKGVETNKKPKFPVHQRSPCSPPATISNTVSVMCEYTVTDASVGRRDSDSPVHSEPGRPRRRASFSPAGQQGGGDPLKHRTKTIVKPPRPKYTDASVQTDDAQDETPWWQQDHNMSPPRPPRLPLRKRLMQSLLRDREDAVAIFIEDKKRKHDDDTVSHSPENSPAPKTVKLSCGGSAPPKSAPPTDIKQSEETESIALRWAAANSVKSAAEDSAAEGPAIHVLDNSIKLPPPIRPSGPALADIFADSDLLAFHQVQGAAVPLKSPSEQSQSSPPNDQPPVNGFRSSGLHVQLPQGSSLPNNSTTLLVQNKSTPSTVVLQPPLSVIPNLANTSNSVFNNSLVQPSPTRTKKLSLKDYGKRKQKVETIDKAEEKTGIRPGHQGSAVSLGSAQGPSNLASSEEPRKIIDSPPALMPVVSPPTPEPLLALDSARIPTGPKEQRAGNAWSVR